MRFWSNTNRTYGQNVKVGFGRQFEISPFFKSHHHSCEFCRSASHICNAQSKTWNDGGIAKQFIAALPLHSNDPGSLGINDRLSIKQSGISSILSNLDVFP